MTDREPDNVTQISSDAPLALEITFHDLEALRDQALMITACMEHIIARTAWTPDCGDLRQRLEARREVESLRRVLARFNGS
jgi:hypothetical protein